MTEGQVFMEFMMRSEEEAMAIVIELLGPGRALHWPSTHCNQPDCLDVTESASKCQLLFSPTP